MTPSMTAEEMAAVRLAEAIGQAGPDAPYHLASPGEMELLASAVISLARVMPVVAAARAVRETDKSWMVAGAPEHGELANAAANAHIRLESALAAIDTAITAMPRESAAQVRERHGFPTLSDEKRRENVEANIDAMHDEET